ncbi:hypothetical protein Q5P01_014171 [Channa striata]|uniref:Olfactory receptor n=1 Tax=Channa striata TaxID=64152 RepID=A0AA88MLP3_CHASR|nr:hypothetical protein Q5P01_014171 [Channa striata]
MDDEPNVTYITLNGYVDVHKYRYLYFCVMFMLFIVIICFNVTIVCLIWIHKNLHEPMYIFIAALLLNSVLYSTTMYPKLLIDFLSEKQIISYSACLFQFFLYYTLNSSEFLLLAAMSYDRYVSICKPLHYPNIMRKTNMSILLFFSWSVPACHVTVPVMLSAETKLCNFTINGIFCNNAIYELQCIQSDALNLYGLISLLDLVVLPMAFIVFTYTKIFIITNRSGKEVRKKAAETCLPHLLVLFSFFCLSVLVSIARVEDNLPETARLIMTLQMFSYHALFNPLIYGIKMKDISKHLRSLLCPSKII